MSKKIRQFWDNYNNFSKSDRNAILILSVLILLSVIANIIVSNIHPKSKFNTAEYEQLLKNLTLQNNNFESGSKTLFVFDPNTIIPEMLDSLDLPGNIKRNILNYREAGGRFNNPSQLRKIYGMNDSIFALIKEYVVISETLDSVDSNHIVKYKSINGVFDPNIADFNQLIDFGFNSFQAKNLINFRSKAGVFRNKKDLLKIYGIDTVFFKSIENYIQIENFEVTKPENVKSVLVNVELNSADSTKLIQLAGIGSVFAKRILKYRDLLGGFYSTAQLGAAP